MLTLLNISLSTIRCLVDTVQVRAITYLFYWELTVRATTSGCFGSWEVLRSGESPHRPLRFIVALLGSQMCVPDAKPPPSAADTQGLVPLLLGVCRHRSVPR